MSSYLFSLKYKWLVRERNHHLDVQKHTHSYNSPRIHATTQEYKNTQYRHGKESIKKKYIIRDKQYRTEQNTYTNKNNRRLTIKRSNLHTHEPEKFFVNSQLPSEQLYPI